MRQILWFYQYFLNNNHFFLNFIAELIETKYKLYQSAIDVSHTNIQMYLNSHGLNSNTHETLKFLAHSQKCDDQEY